MVYCILNNMQTVFPDSIMLSRNVSSYNLNLSCKPFIKGAEGSPTVMKYLSAVLQVQSVISVGSLLNNACLLAVWHLESSQICVGSDYLEKRFKRKLFERSSSKKLFFCLFLYSLFLCDFCFDLCFCVSSIISVLCCF